MLINKLLNIAKNVAFEYNNKKHFFNWPKAFWYAICPYLKKYGESKHEAILRFLTEEELGIIEKYSCFEITNKRLEAKYYISDDCPIWVMWWQGLNHVPPIVELCINSILRNKGNHPVYFLDKANYKEYIDLPVGLEEKLVGKNNIAHLTDVIRFGLLSKYGGIWLDATIYVSKPIDGWQLPLYSIRHESPNPKYVLGGWRWSTFMFACAENEVLPKFIFEALLDYFNKHEWLIDYFLLDYMIAIIYNNNKYVKEEIDSFPKNNIGALDLLMNLSKPYDEIWLKSCLQNRQFHKLDWRIKVESPDSILAYLMNNR